VSRQLRAGEPGKPRAFRVTDAEWTEWERAAKAEGCATVSAWAVKTLNRRAAQLAAKARRRGPRVGL
jgi:hypothetical protein